MKSNDNFMELYSSTKFVLIEEFSLPRAFAILTAHNPEGIICNVNLNNFYDADLRESLITHGEVQYFHPVIGCSPDMSHQEESYAIETPKNRAYEIAEKFNQNAFFWVDKGQLSIVPVKLKGVTEMSAGTFKSHIISTKNKHASSKI